MPQPRRGSLSQAEERAHTQPKKRVSSGSAPRNSIYGDDAPYSPLSLPKARPASARENFYGPPPRCDLAPRRSRQPRSNHNGPASQRPHVRHRRSRAGPLQPRAGQGDGSNKAQKSIVNKKSKKTEEDEDDDPVC